MGVEHTDNVTPTETTDKPTSSERPYSPPPDNPGSPGQPSRLEDRARVREQDREGAEQSAQTAGSGTEQSAEREDDPTAAQNDSNGEASGQSEISRQEKDEDEPLEQDDNSHERGTLGGEVTGEGDQPSPDIRTPETERFQNQESEPLPQQDAPVPGGADEPRGPEHSAPDTGKPADQIIPAPEHETTDQHTKPQQSHAESDAPDNDHGKKIEDAPSTPTDQGSSQSGETEGSVADSVISWASSRPRLMTRRTPLKNSQNQLKTTSRTSGRLAGSAERATVAIK